MLDTKATFRPDEMNARDPLTFGLDRETLDMDGTDQCFVGRIANEGLDDAQKEGLGSYLGLSAGRLKLGNVAQPRLRVFFIAAPVQIVPHSVNHRLLHEVVGHEEKLLESLVVVPTVVAE